VLIVTNCYCNYLLFIRNNSRSFDFVITGLFSYQAFINTELYARVSVAVLFYKLADLACMVGSPNEDTNCIAALDSGRSFLLELLDSAVVDYYYLMIRNKFYAKFCSNYLLIILNTEICTVCYVLGLLRYHVLLVL
jgi:hypothetical protein